MRVLLGYWCVLLLRVDIGFNMCSYAIENKKMTWLIPFSINWRMFSRLPQHTWWIAWTYFSALGDPVEGEMLHIERFTTWENKLRHPLPNDWRELEDVPTDWKILPMLGFLACALLVAFCSMKMNERPPLWSSWLHERWVPWSASFSQAVFAYSWEGSGLPLK